MNRFVLAVSGSFAVAISLVAAALARADEPVTPAAGPAPGAPPVPDVPTDDSNAMRPNPPERGFLFTVEPTVPEPGHAVVGLGMGNVARTGEERPVGSGPIFPTAGVEIGILSRLSLYAEGGAVFIQSGNPGALASPFILDTGAHISLTDPTSRHWRLSIRPSVNFDVDDSWTANLTVTLGWYYGPVRVIGSYMGSHTFQPGSDPIDMQITLGATYTLPLGFRLGLEGVVSDLEELFQAGAEGGSSAFAGPTAGWESGRFQIVAGPGIGITPGALNDPFLFRLALAVRL